MPENRRKTAIKRCSAVGRRSRSEQCEKQRAHGRLAVEFRRRSEHRERFFERSEQTNGLTRRQRHFILERLVGQSDKSAALAAGYPLSMAENTKQKIWARPGVREEFERLKGIMIEVFSELARKQLEVSP